ncbi:hypothetical protein ACFSO7_02585 [Bacillus sp. CGMCC 1.16607]|uniref:hypothetical protein n=1 Tax=Bacillus sp. CGMCC 1.16607 TaxID=3351842 RepID=UPI00362F4455
MKKKITILTLVLTLLISVPSFNVLAVSKSPSIEQLQRQIASLTKQIKNLTSNIATKNKENKELKANLDKVTEELNKSKDENISLKQQLEEKINEINEKNKKIEELIKKADQLSKAQIIYTDSNRNIVSKDTTGAIKWYKFQTTMTTIFLTESAYQEVGYILDLADEVITDVGSYFGATKLPQGVTAYIWQNEKVAQTSYGEYVARDKRVLIDVSKFAPYNNSNEENFIGVFVHEFAHAFQDTYQNFNSIRDKFKSNMMWINEGVASYVDGQHIDYSKYHLPKNQLTMRYKYNKDVYKERVLGSMSYFGKDINDLKELLDDSFFKVDAPSESMIYYIEEKYSHKKFFDFIEGLRTQSINDSMVKNFGVTEAQFIQDWRQYYGL